MQNITFIMKIIVNHIWKTFTYLKYSIYTLWIELILSVKKFNKNFTVQIYLLLLKYELHSMILIFYYTIKEYFPRNREDLKIKKYQEIGKIFN